MGCRPGSGRCAISSTTAKTGTGGTAKLLQEDGGANLSGMSRNPPHRASSSRRKCDPKEINAAKPAMLQLAIAISAVAIFP